MERINITEFRQQLKDFDYHKIMIASLRGMKVTILENADPNIAEAKYLDNAVDFSIIPKKLVRKKERLSKRLTKVEEISDKIIDTAKNTSELTNSDIKEIAKKLTKAEALVDKIGSLIPKKYTTEDGKVEDAEYVVIHFRE